MTQIGSTSYHLTDGKIWECSDSQTDQCLILPDQTLTVKKLFVEQGEVFALAQRASRDVLFHFKQQDQEWQEFSFDITLSCNAMSGICQVDERDPVSLSVEQGHVIIELDDGSKERARVVPGDMFFSSHSNPIQTEKISQGLHFIAATDGAPNRFMMVKLPSSFGPASIDNRWEKIQARDWLIEKLGSVDSDQEKANFQEAIDRLDETIEDNQIIFEPNKAVSDNTYCEDGACRSVLSELAYNESAKVYTMRFTNFIPDQLNLTSQDWDYITKPFATHIDNADQERAAIAEAAQRWELLAGAQTGTAQDIGGWAGNIAGLIPSWIPVVGQETGQTNCNYEYFNMRELMRKLQAGDYLQYHEVPEAYAESLATIGGGMIHQALRIKEKESDTCYVVDSWPKGNGYPPLIMPEDDWGVLTASSSQIFPTQQSMDQLGSQQRLATGALGLGITALLARRGIYKEMTPVRLSVPFSQWDTLVARHGETLNARTQFATGIQMYSHRFGGVRKDILTTDGLERSYQVVEEATLSKFPKEVDARVLGEIQRTSTGYKPKTKTIRLFRIERTALHNPIQWGTLRYLMKPQGALNFGLMALFGTEALSAVFAEQAHGLPNATTVTRSRIADMLASYTATGYIGAEGAMAVRYGSTPLLYELPVAGPPFMLGATVTGGLSNELGEAFDVRTFQHGGAGQFAAEVGGGTAAVYAAKKAVGQQVWNGATQSVNRFGMQTVGEAGLALETGALAGLEAATLGEIAASGSAATIGASALLVAAAGAVGVGVGLLYNKLIMKPIVEPYILEPYVDPLYAKHLLPTQEFIEDKWCQLWD